MADIKKESRPDGGLDARIEPPASHQCCCQCHAEKQETESNQDASSEDVKPATGNIRKTRNAGPRVLSRSFNCGFCREKFDEADLLTTHLATHDIRSKHRTVGCQTISKSFLCGWCAVAFTEPSEVRKHLDTHHSESTTAPKPENSEYDHEETERIPNTSGKHGISESLLQYPYDQIVGGANDHDKFSSERVEIGVKTEPLDEAMDDRSFSSCTADVSHSYARGDGHSLGSEGALDFTLARREASGNGCTSPSKSKETIDGLYENACTSGETHHNHDAEQELFQSTGDVETDSESCGGSNLSVIAKREAVSPEMQSEEHDYVAEVLHGKDHAIPSTSVAHTDLVCKQVKLRVCKICQAQYIGTQDILEVHMQKHHRQFNCEHCEKTFSNFRNLTQHKLKHAHTTVGPYGCEFCGKTFQRKDALLYHMYTHSTAENSFKIRCKDCSECFASLDELAQHFLTEGHPPRCEVCKAAFATRETLEAHMNTHSRERPFECSICSNGFATADLLKSHKAECKVKKQLFKCDQCDKTFSKIGNLENHKIVHSDAKPYVCECCGMSFKAKSTWQNHVLTHRTENPFKCKMCDKCFSDPAHLSQHRKDSHPETQPTPNVPAVELPRTPPFVCPFCGRNFARKETLQFHTYTHTKEKPFKCDECDKGFIRRFLLRQHKRMEHPHNEEVAMDHLSQHMMDIHPETQPTPSVPAVELPCTSPFGCQFCGRTFARKETLQLHTYAHTGEKPFACDECDKGFVRHFLLRQHKRMEHPQNEEVAVDHPSQHMTAGHPETQPTPSVLAVEVPRTPPFVCPFCGRNFARKQTLQCHIYTHTRETPFKCDECDKGFIRRFLLRQHKRMDHPQNGEAALDPRPFVCHICSRNFHKKDTWQNHMFTHTHEKPYKCEECDKSFIRPCKLTQHMQQYHPEIQAAIERLDGVRCRPYVCTVCHMSFSGNDTLQSHMSTNHAEETTFQCEVCAESFTRRSQLNQHRRKHRKKKTYNCSLCSKSFLTHTGFKNHMAAHKGERPFICEFCGHTFAKKENWQFHVNTHTGEKPYKCKQCDACFSARSSITVHKRRVHTMEKPYICDQCGASFFTSSAMKKHMLRHTDIFPFVCAQCGRKFRYKKNLTSHMKTHKLTQIQN